jgi:endonuclease YncB( thermonuclease family)
MPSPFRYRWSRRLPTLLLLAALLALAAWMQRPPAPSVGPERVAERFTICGQASSHACVIDGDSFHLGQRKIRIRGIDAPERKGSCPAETARAALASQKLRDLLDAGPFVMTAVGGDERDQYGRELRVLERDGKPIGAAMVEAGLAHAYRGHKTSWC